MSRVAPRHHLRFHAMGRHCQWHPGDTHCVYVVQLSWCGGDQHHHLNYGVPHNHQLLVVLGVVVRQPGTGVITPFKFANRLVCVMQTIDIIHGLWRLKFGRSSMEVTQWWFRSASNCLCGRIVTFWCVSHDTYLDANSKIPYCVLIQLPTPRVTSRYARKCSEIITSHGPTAI